MEKTAERLVSEIKVHLEVISKLEKLNTPLNPTAPSIDHLIGLIQINLRLLKRNYPKEYRSIPKSLITLSRTVNENKDPLAQEVWSQGYKQYFSEADIFSRMSFSQWEAIREAKERRSQSFDNPGCLSILIPVLILS
jgi:hypothetical protein